MRLHPRCVVVLMFLLVPTSAHAHLHVWDLAFGPAAATGSTLVGGHFSIGLTIKEPFDRRLSILIDVTNLKDEENGQHTTLLAYLGGPRWAITKHPRHSLMVHGLFGLTRKHQGAAAESDFPTVAVGAAYEWVWQPTAKVGDAGWAARVQAERTFPLQNQVKRYTQFSASLVRRFE